MVENALPPFSRELHLSAYRVHRDLALLVLAVVAFALPFLSQPFHMDDNFYLDMARNALSSPLYPNDTPYVFQGIALPDMASHSHPPLHTYFLALVLRFAGDGTGREWVFHSCALIFPVAAVIAFYFIAAAFVERPLWPALVLAATPLFLVMQHTLMTDVPTLAWWLAAIAFFLRGTGTGSAALLAASSLCQFGAMFTSYQSVALTFLLGFYQWRRKDGLAGWIAIALPPCAIAAWLGINYAHYGRFLLAGTAGYIASRDPLSAGALWTKLVAVIEYQGWLLIFPAFLLYLASRVLRGRVLALLVVLSVYMTGLAVPAYHPADKLVFGIGLMSGLAVLLFFAAFTIGAFKDPQRTGFGTLHGQFLALWYGGVFVFCLFLFTEGSARYVLPLVPPVLICFFRRLELAEAVEYRRPKPIMSAAMIASGSLVLSLCWGLLLAHADQEFARVYPRAAGEFARVTGGMRSFYAGEWGFRYYFRRAGAQQLPPDESKVAGGSWVARPRLALPYDVPAALWSMSAPVHTLAYDLRTPLRTLDWRSPAGFYSTAWGLVPFSLSRDSLELVDVRQVDYLIERLPCARVESPSPRSAWPGVVDVQGVSSLALLVRPESTVIYDWQADQDLVLGVSLGLSPGSYSAGEDNPVRFTLQQRSHTGEILQRQEHVLNPGQIREHRRWKPCNLVLRGAGRSTLELSVSAAKRNTAAIAAFARALLTPGNNSGVPVRQWAGGQDELPTRVSLPGESSGTLVRDMTPELLRGPGVRRLEVTRDGRRLGCGVLVAPATAYLALTGVQGRLALRLVATPVFNLGDGFEMRAYVKGPGASRQILSRYFDAGRRGADRTWISVAVPIDFDMRDEALQIEVSGGPQGDLIDDWLAVASVELLAEGVSR